MTTESEAGCIRPAVLVQYHNAGFKLVPINEVGKPKIEWGSIYELSDWTPEKLIQEAYMFKNVATCFGKTHLRDTEGRELYLNCLDIDSQKVYDILSNLQNGDNEKTYSLLPRMQECSMVIKTRKPLGFHVYWLSHIQNKAIHTDNCKPGFEFEIKTDKGSALGTLPGSTHRDDPNFHYNNIGQQKLFVSDELYDKLVEILAECLARPDDKNSGERKSAYRNINNTNRIELDNQEVESVASLISPYYKHPHRNSLVYGLCGLFHKSNISKESTLNLIQILAKDDEEKKSRIAVVDETYNKDPKMVSGTSYLLGILRCIVVEIEAKEILNKIFGIIGKGNDVIQRLTREIMKEYTFKTMTDTDEMCYYDKEKGLYLLNAEWRIKELGDLMCPEISTHELQEVINHIKHKTYVDRSEFDSNPDILNLENGLLNIHTLELSEHSPDKYSLVQIPVKHDPDAKCTKFLQFLNDVLKPKDIPIMLQFIGYCLYKTSVYEKAVLCIGKGDNGKSTLLTVLERFFGVNNRSSVSLQDLSGGNRFASVDLYGKLVNTFADLKKEKLKDTGPFKMIVSGDTIRGEKKGKQAFNFKNFAKLIFSCNDIPESDDTGYAYFKRWIIFHFERAFTGKEKNRNLKDEISTPEERSGLLNLALDALRQLIEDNGFVDADDIEKVAEDYMANTGAIARFVDTKCQITRNNNDIIVCRELWGLYYDYCKQNQIIDIKDDNIFGMEILQMHVVKKRVKISNHQEYCYVGIKYLGEYKPESKNVERNPNQQEADPTQTRLSNSDN
jgi:P4 family phage/plasmid primase-like protien